MGRLRHCFSTNVIIVRWDDDKQCYVPSDQYGFLKTHAEVRELYELLEKYIQSYTSQEINDENNKLKAGYSAKTELEQHSKIAGHIYLLKDSSGYIKIGCSENYKKRVRSLQYSNPTVKVIKLIKTKDIIGLESLLHETFAHRRIKGEWFSLTDDDMNQIDKIAEGIAEE